MESELVTTAQEFSAQLQKLEAEHLQIALYMFQVLEKRDPETACLAIKAHVDRAAAALWFTDRIRSLGGTTPWDALATGNVERVRQVLNAIEYGVYL